MKLKSYLPILAVAMVVIAAGCTSHSGSTISTNDGVVINSFESDDTTLYSGSSTTLYLDVQNVGGVDASDVWVYLLGAEGWKPTQSPSKQIGKLEAPKEGIPSSPRTITWHVTAPQLPEGVKQPFQITARVVYHYKSNAAGKIDVYSDEEWRRTMSQNPTASTVVPVQNSPGPIHVSIIGPSAVKLSSYQDGIPLNIKISNSGSGYPIKDVNSWDKPQLSGTITVIGGGTIQCYNDDGTQTGKSSSVTLNDMDMRYRKPKSISCQLYPDLQGQPYEPVTISFSFDYNYYVQKSLTINVIGKKQH